MIRSTWDALTTRSAASLVYAPLTVVAVVLGVLRLAGITSPLYQALAHVYVGGLFGAYLAGRDRAVLSLALALTVLEAAAFVVTRIL